MRRIAFVCLFALPLVAAEQPAKPATAADAPSRDSSYIDANGTAHVTRVVPVPQDLSPQARKFISRVAPDEAARESLTARRAHMEEWAVRANSEWSKLCPNHIENTKIGGVPVRVVTPRNMPASNRDKVLMNLHGGGFNADSGSYAESIPIAGYTGIKVVAVLYRLAPEHPFPAAVNDAVAVYRELLKTYPKDAVLSPIYADLHGLPPALFVSSERDALLSCTINLHRAYLRAGVDARLVVFDALPHAFWYQPELPESIEANQIMARFFLSHLAK